MFLIGSVSKQFIAAGLMLLAQDGKLRVSDHVGKYIPDAPLSNRASGYVFRDGAWSAAPSFVALRPSGAFVSTATDMAKWAAALDGDRVLSKATKAEMWTPVALNGGGTFPDSGRDSRALPKQGLSVICW